MATTVVEPTSAPPASVRRSRGALVLRVIGWTLIAAGAVVLLYVVYALWFTGLETERAQSDMLAAWEAEVGPLDAESPAPPQEEGADEGEDEAPESPAIDLDGAIAVLAFERPGADEPPVLDEPVAVVPGVGVGDLQRGPGHYPGTAEPGGDGNFAVAGHRVTYSSPFHYLDELEEGDLLHVWDRDGARHTYEIHGTEIVSPHETWVLDADPLEIGAPTVTLTTCHPRYSDRERLIAFGELVG